jgi:arginyl-tRNA synthetase
VKRLSVAVQHLIIQGIENAQEAGDLPAFALPAINVSSPKRDDQGDYAYPAMPLAKLGKKAPRAIAEDIVKHMPAADFIEKVEIAGPGFINLYVSETYLKQQVETIIAEGSDDLFTLDLGAEQRAQVEFVSANPSGPVTLGHTRNAVVGDAMARLLTAAGYAVQREYYFNNAGQQMIKLGKTLQARYLQALGEAVAIPEDGYKGTYLIEIAQDLVAKQGDALKNDDWETFKDIAETRMFDWIKESLTKIDVAHDAFFNEDSLFQTKAVWETLDQLQQNGYIYEDIVWEGADADERADAEAKNYQAAKWFRSSKLGDDKDRVVVKSDGTPTYTMPDIAYHKNKLERGFDIAVNVLGADHYTQAQVVRRGVEALGLSSDPINVILIQMVKAVHTDPETGEKAELKESKRAGTFTTLDDLVDLTGADPIRYYMLERSPSSQLTFDVDEAVKQSNENPVYYIQNAHVRCCGIFREADERGFDDAGADLSLLGDDELTFIRKTLELGDVIELAVTTYEPHKIAHYAQELASIFHPIYDRVRVLHGDVPEDLAKARLRFYKAAQIVFERVLRLMGMSAPERM